MGHLIIVRGISGSGKSTLAQELVRTGHAQYAFGADQFMVNEAGEYDWRPEKLHHAHHECFLHVTDILDDGDTVILSNTSLRKRDVTEYLNYCNEYNHTIEIITVLGDHGSIHGVADHTMARQRHRLAVASDWVSQYPNSTYPLQE